MELTELELDILRLLAAGKMLKEIATELNYSYYYIGHNREQIMKKLGAKSTPNAVAIAIRTGLIAPPTNGRSRTNV